LQELRENISKDGWDPTETTTLKDLISRRVLEGEVESQRK
jgi:hypothetical protein